MIGGTLSVDGWAVTFWYSEEGTGRGRSQPSALLAVPKVTVHPPTASVPITVLLCNGPLLCGFNVPVKGLKRLRRNGCSYLWIGNGFYRPKFGTKSK